eukprot:gnl/TRDRNA2_/TRDRNA2_200783_c0_seq1.p1 gnl/TRDRNA2_/TRDRNA2_200783_c0~~gnl/TRDRNA2_/TRDRNA2_200783_c0_seq1.p1  ORF type:complete len:319 (+),score=59.58 gnl/TRDRNA2_/TRDRNA2_200783_c0_seq1:73-1029(+)
MLAATASAAVPGWRIVRCTVQMFWLLLALCKLQNCTAAVANVFDMPVAGGRFATFAVRNLKNGGGSGNFTVEVHPDWSPRGAARFFELVKSDFFNQVRFFRVVSGFMAQFGISGDPKVSAVWREKSIKDDKVKAENRRGRLTFATSGKNTRTTQMFINFVDNTFLDAQGFSPFAEVISGMDVVDHLYSGYGEGAPRGRGPDQGSIASRGNKYLEKAFPKMSYIEVVELSSSAPAASSATIVEGPSDLEPNPRSSKLAGVFAALAMTFLIFLVGTAVCVNRSKRLAPGNPSLPQGRSAPCACCSELPAVSVGRQMPAAE